MIRISIDTEGLRRLLSNKKNDKTYSFKRFGRVVSGLLDSIGMSLNGHVATGVVLSLLSN